MYKYGLVLATALACNDILVDDFKVATFKPLDIETPAPMRYFNLLGGDYGIKEEPGVLSKIEVKADPKNGYMDFIAGWGSEDTSESNTHPNMPNSHNYWYAKFDKYACYDLTPFTAIEFDLVAPANAEMTFVLTQKAPNCTEFPTKTARLIDSAYTTLGKYITPDGTKKTVTLPLSDFAKNVIGDDFDMKHLKDFTIINIKPNDFHFQMSNFKLIGNPAVSGAACNVATTSASKPAATTMNTSEKNQFFGLTTIVAVLISL